MSVKKGIWNSSSSKDYFSANLSKKGQVTIFIIVGIIILFAFAGILYLTKTTLKEKLTTEGEPIISEAPQTFQPIQAYTENCLGQVGKRGLLILGEQGGYIYPDLVGKFSVSEPTEADGLNLEPLKVPYWYYNQEPNSNAKVVYASLQPQLYAKEDPVMSVEAQLSRFVKEKLDSCLEGYAPFIEQGSEISVQKEEKKTTVTIGESSVNFWLQMNVKARKGGEETTLEQFYVKVPLPLKKYYETAQEITLVERNYSFLERQALDLISTYSAVDVNKLPPTEAVTFDLLPRAYWSEAEVKERVKGMLISNVPLLRYLGGSNFYRYDYQPSAAAVADWSDLYQKNYDNMILPLEKGNGLEVSFDYFGWEPYLDVNDKGGLVGPSTSQVNFNVLHFATNHYYTTYDLSYPVLVTLRDPTALSGEGFNFAFSLEANLRNNQILKSGEEQKGAVADVGKSMVCDENKKNTELLKTVVVDSFTKEPLEAVQVGFSIPEQGDCLMGVTNGKGELETKYPAVYGGVVSYIKEDYLTDFYPIDTYRFQKEKGIIGYAVSGLKAGLPEQVIEMHKMKNINITVKKKNLEKCLGDTCFAQSLFGGGEAVYSYQPQMLAEKHRWVFVDAAQNLNEKETATVMLKRVADLNPIIGDDFVASASVTGQGKAEMQLVPGVYEVTGLLTSEEKLVIPKEERCVEEGFVGTVTCWIAGGCCFTFNEQVLDKPLIGQVTWDTSKTYVKITPEQLYDSDQITFYVLAFNEKAVPLEEHKRVLEDLQVMGQLGNISQLLEVRAALRPVFK